MIRTGLGEIREKLGAVAICFALTACLDTSRDVWVAGSAEEAMPVILQAVEDLNEATGTESFRIIGVGGACERRNNAVVMCVGKHPEDGFAGYTKLTSRGARISIEPGVRSHVVAHELCHAAGLDHVDDKRNLMALTARDGWTLEEWQLDELR